MWMPEWILLALVGWENADWDPKARPILRNGKKWWARWLTQMIPTTWDIYWYWKGKKISQESPVNQFIWATNYLDAIKIKHWLPNTIDGWSEAFAYYNTWMSFDKNSKRKVPENYLDNKAILRKVYWYEQGTKHL